MLGLPKSTEVSLPLYKKDILANFEGTLKQKNLFNDDIASLRITNELSSRSLPVESSKTINGIFIIEVVPKCQAIHQEAIEMMFRLIPQHIVLTIHFDESIRLAIHQSKTFMTDWMQIGYTLNIEGLSIDEIWKHIVEVIGNFQVAEGRTLDDQILINQKIENLNIQIGKLQKEKDKSKTPTRKYDLNCRIRSLQGEIRRLQDEKA